MIRNEEIILQMERNLEILKEKLKKNPEDSSGFLALRLKFPYNSGDDALKSLLLQNRYDQKTLAELLYRENQAWNQRMHKSEEMK